MARDMVFSRLPDTTAPSQIEHLSHVPQKLRQITRVTAGKKPEETVAIIDSQSTRTTEEASIKGFDAGKKTKGRKRHIAVDTMGLLVEVLIHSAGIQDRDGGRFLFSKARDQWSNVYQKLC